MNRRIGSLFARAGWLALVIYALAALPALATTTSLEVFASWGNTSPGIRRNTSGTGPITDTATDLFGGSSSTGSASVDAFGVHASATATSSSSAPFATASASGQAGLVNTFTIIPRAGFSGTHALVQVPYSLSGSFLSHPSLAACATCFGAVDARLSVDGMLENFFFLGAHSQGTMGNANFVAGGVSQAGVIQGLLPVNTPLFLRAGLLVPVHCQSDDVSSCGIDAAFTLSYAGFSLDEVDIVWDLVPMLVPEPTAGALLAAGLVGLGAVARRKRGRRTPVLTTRRGNSPH